MELLRSILEQLLVMIKIIHWIMMLVIVYQVLEIKKLKDL